MTNPLSSIKQAYVGYKYKGKIDPNATAHNQKNLGPRGQELMQERGVDSVEFFGGHATFATPLHQYRLDGVIRNQIMQDPTRSIDFKH